MAVALRSFESMTIPNPALSVKLLPGQGTITLGAHGSSAHFSRLQFSYPLKLISPARQFHPKVGCLYVLSYGGGLVAGDRVELDVEVLSGAKLVLLTQGSTKVFKTRPGRYPTAALLPDGTQPTRTIQQIVATVAPSASLILLPSPVTCFSQADYSQRQTFHLFPGSNLVLLDWYNSGRSAMTSASTSGERVISDTGEEWLFSRFRSSNIVTLDGKSIVKDVLLLEPSQGDESFTARVLPYSTYATLFLIGPQMAPLREHFKRAFEQVVQYPQGLPYSLVWSYSELEGEVGVARCAGASTEEVRDWVKQVLGQGGIVDIIGEDLWGNAFT